MALAPRPRWPGSSSTRSMAGSGVTRAWLPNRAYVGTTMIVLAVLVLVVIGAFAASLGDDPAYAWDCDDTTCEDLWAVPRAHYLRVAGSCILAIFVGWAIAGSGMPSAPLPPDRRLPRAFDAGRETWMVVLIAPTVAAAAGGFLAVLGSRPWGIAGATVTLLVACLVAGRDLVGRGCSPRASWYLAGGGAAFAATLTLTTMAIGYPGRHLWSLPVGTGLGGVTWASLHTLLTRRRSRLSSRPEIRRSDSVRSIPRPRPADVGCMLVLSSVAVWAAWPVPALPADAWMYGATHSAWLTGTLVGRSP